MGGYKASQLGRHGNWAAEMERENMASDGGIIEGIRQDLTAGGGRVGSSSCGWIRCRQPERCNGGEGKDGDCHGKRERAEDSMLCSLMSNMFH